MDLQTMFACELHHVHKLEGYLIHMRNSKQCSLCREREIMVFVDGSEMESISPTGLNAAPTLATKRENIVGWEDRNLCALVTPVNIVKNSCLYYMTWVAMAKYAYDELQGIYWGSKKRVSEMKSCWIKDGKMIKTWVNTVHDRSSWIDCRWSNKSRWWTTWIISWKYLIVVPRSKMQLMF